MKPVSLFHVSSPLLFVPLRNGQSGPEGRTGSDGRPVDQAFQIDMLKPCVVSRVSLEDDGAQWCHGESHLELPLAALRSSRDGKW